MGEAHVADVVGEPRRELAVGEKAVALLGDPAPRAQVHLVHAHGLVEGLPAPALRHPGGIAPGVAREGSGDRGGARRVGLEREGEGIGLLGDGRARTGKDLELVPQIGPERRDEELPDAVGRMQAHGMPPPVPAVPVAHHAHAARVGGPHREAVAVHAVEARRVRAELVVDAVVGAFAEEMQIEVGQRGRKAIGILELADDALPFGHTQTVREGRGAPTRGRRDARLPEAGGVDASRGMRGAALAGRDLHRAGVGEEGADGQRAVVIDVGAENRERVAVLAHDEGADRVGGKAHPPIVRRGTTRTSG